MSIGTVSPTASPLQANPMGMEDFLKILLTQLTYQDPLKPMDNEQFMAQVAQFTALEQSQQVNDKMSLLVANQAALQSVGLLGRTVDLATSAGSLTGTVTALSLAGDSPSLTVTTSSGAALAGVTLDQISSVR
ncbi:MAG TPA: flagellar hook capping FlgD N-terminal domain-containing protein [Ramlibacter sp.]|uniref:flagellar hook assembly protein FlgD n=1 Tax=Ramlibacter sp. TaxID=1917967 RepID=UPI002D1B25FA|nr:flagellar hook capping FlgD N-terminal domain-containing protein [Ramlibacter sp.]HVZ46117.1 flagellar hook capping FlgD N-terminal domain-containing protein [Ramlibacter sp.]